MNEFDRINSALAYVPADDRNLWVKIGMAIKSELGDSGFDIWNNWSQQAATYKTSDAQSVWRSINPNGGVTIGTLFHEAKTSGWRDDEPHLKPSSEELAARQHKTKEREAQEQAAIKKERANTATMAANIFKAATAAQINHPYLLRKQISPLETLREIDAGAAAAILGYTPKSGSEPLTGRLLVVPVKQGNGLATLELIDSEGCKAALAGRGTKTGGYWVTERLPEGDGDGLTLLIGEGMATALSAKDATGYLAIAALSSGNLLAVAKAMRERYPRATLVILADLVKTDGQPDRNAINAATSVNGKLALPDFGSNRSTNQTDFNDLAAICGKEAVKQCISKAIRSSGSWPEAQSLGASYLPEPYPLDALPNTIRAAVEEVAGFVKAPLPLVASCALAALSLAIQAHVDVKRADKLLGPTGLYLLTIADSGERKSTCDGFFTKVIRDHEAAKAEDAKPYLKKYKADIQAWEAKQNGIKEKIRHLARDGKPTTEHESSMRELEQEKPEPPRIARLIYADVTPEALASLLAKQWPSGGVVSAEAGIVFGSHGMGKDSVMRNLGLLNQLWDGIPLTIDRKTSESFTVKGARLTVALQVQESTLREFFSKAGALARGTGFLARFLIAWPESTQGNRPFTDAPSNWPALTVFNKQLAAILNKPEPIDDDGVLTPLMLQLSPEAKRAWVEYHDEIECKIASGGELYDVRDVAAKSADNAARLAALFHVFEHGHGDICKECVSRACTITAWHLSESRRFFGEQALPEELADAARLDRWLIDHCKRERVETVNKRYLRQHGPIRDGKRLDNAMRELIDINRIRTLKDGKRVNVWINPSLQEEGT